MKMQGEQTKMTKLLNVWKKDFEEISADTNKVKGVAAKLGESSQAQTLEFEAIRKTIKDTFTIPGLIGEKKSQNAYQSMQQCL